MNEFLLPSMAACGLVTFLIRLSFIAFGHRLPNDGRLDSLLRYVPPAILGALIAPEIFVADGQLNTDPANPRLAAMLLALLVAWRTRSVLASIVTGMAALWTLQAWGG